MTDGKNSVIMAAAARNGQYEREKVIPIRYKQSMFNVYFEDDGKQYVFNTFSNGLSRLDADTYQNVVNGTPEKTAYLDALLSEGYVVPEQADELNRLMVERLSYQYGRGRSMQFLIVPSLKCNLKCIYCYQRDVSYNKSVLTPEMVADSIRFIEKTVESNPYAARLKLNWFGGEPLLHFDIIRQYTEHFIKYCSEKNLEYSANMTTNGLLLTKEVTDYMYAHGLKTLQVTIDGTEAADRSPLFERSKPTQQ